MSMRYALASQLLPGDLIVKYESGSAIVFDDNEDGSEFTIADQSPALVIYAKGKRFNTKDNGSDVLCVLLHEGKVRVKVNIWHRLSFVVFR